MDMIAYNPSGALHDQAYVYYADATAPLIAGELSDAITLYGDGLSTTIARLASASSDHYPFYAQGFDAALLIERNVWTNPNYHQALDSVDTANYIDYGYATKMTRGVVGYLATEAKVVPEPGAIVMLIAARHWLRRLCLETIKAGNVGSKTKVFGGMTRELGQARRRPPEIHPVLFVDQESTRVAGYVPESPENMSSCECSPR